MGDWALPSDALGEEEEGCWQRVNFEKLVPLGQERHRAQSTMNSPEGTVHGNENYAEAGRAPRVASWAAIGFVEPLGEGEKERRHSWVVRERPGRKDGGGTHVTGTPPWSCPERARARLLRPPRPAAFRSPAVLRYRSYARIASARRTRRSKENARRIVVGTSVQERPVVRSWRTDVNRRLPPNITSGIRDIHRLVVSNPTRSQPPLLPVVVFPTTRRTPSARGRAPFPFRADTDGARHVGVDPGNFPARRSNASSSTE